jgi:hypothetical protein
MASDTATSSHVPSNDKHPFPLEGGCACKYIRYRMGSRPLVVHGCHCHWCQRETGPAFAINAMIEHDRVTHLGPEPELINTPSESGEGQVYARCPKCHIAVWSNYGGPLLRFVRVGTLDQPDHCALRSTSLQQAGSHGSFFRGVCRLEINTTRGKRFGRRKVSSDGRLSKDCAVRRLRLREQQDLRTSLRLHRETKLCSSTLTLRRAHRDSHSAAF